MASKSYIPYKMITIELKQRYDFGANNTMRICFMCDLHLPFNEDSLQYDVLNWAVEDVVKKQADCIAFVGDITCDGNECIV